MPIDPLARVTPRCPRFEQACPQTPCPGAVEPGACDHWHRLSTWRAVSSGAQLARTARAGRATLDPRVRDAVNACPDRGPVLPISQQDDCGCQGREVSLCRAGWGRQSGKVTLADCLGCQTARLAGALTTPEVEAAAPAQPGLARPSLLPGWDG